MEHTQRMQRLAERMSETVRAADAAFPHDPAMREAFLATCAFIQRRALFPEAGEASPFGRVTIKDGIAYIERPKA